MSESKEPRIDAEFSRLLRPQTAEEAQALERLLLEAGRAEHDLVVWDEQNVLLDGHHRLRLCNKHNLPYGVLRKSFPSREAALEWVIRNQMSRRNLTAEESSYLLGKLYLAAKKSPHRPAAEPGQNDPVNSSREKYVDSRDRASAVLAKEAGVAESTVRRAGEFAESVDRVEATAPGAKAEVLSGRAAEPGRPKLRKSDVIAAAKAPEPAKALEEKRKARAGRAEKSPMEVRKTALEALGVAFRCADRLKVYGQVGGLLEQAKKVFYDWRPEN